ncbi:MAG TPA: ROK family protein [Pseudonocardiaceae bacterium]|jgi:glucokinase
MSQVLAVDIGATKFAAAVIDTSGTIHQRAELPIGVTPTAALEQVIDSVFTGDVDAVGIGTAGPLDRVRGMVSPVNIPAWRDFPLIATIRQLVPGVPVRMAGDAQCVALGEWWRWQGTRPAGALLGIVVSTGIGGGLVLDGQPYLGPTGNAGHIGHITVDPRGETCPCGATGCVETIASGPALTRWALRNGWQPAVDADTRALAAAARDGEPVALAAFDRAADALATALLTTAALCDIDHVVIGGGVAAAGDTLLRPIRHALSHRGGMAFLHRMQVRVSALGRDSGLFGAAALALAQPVPTP